MTTRTTSAPPPYVARVTVVPSPGRVRQPLGHRVLPAPVGPHPRPDRVLDRAVLGPGDGPGPRPPANGTYSSSVPWTCRTGTGRPGRQSISPIVPATGAT